MFTACIERMRVLVAVVVAEVTQPSLGVGYELGRAVEMKKRTLCLFRPEEGRSKSPTTKLNSCKLYYNW